MRYLLILALALAMTIAWQTSVVADNPADTVQRCGDATDTKSQHRVPSRNASDCR